MNPRCNRLFTTYGLLIIAGLGLSGCASLKFRNLTDSIVVAAAPALSESETKIVLELRHDVEEVTLSDVDAFLASDRAAKLSRADRDRLRERCEALRATLPQARREFADGVAILRPDPSKAFADGNLAVYVAGRSVARVLFSRDEVGRLLALREYTDDLAAIRYKHPDFESATLGVLRDRLAALKLEPSGLTVSKSDTKRLKTEAATRVLERYLRERNLPLPDGAPLLTSDVLGRPRSPKLTAALKDSSVVERILQDRDPNTLRALLFLDNHDIVELAYP